VVVHIWDKLYGFPFLPRIDPMPDKCIIDDHVDFEYKEEEEDDGNNNPVLRTLLKSNSHNTKQWKDPIKIGKKGTRD
jgi:hypothetical protein